MASGKTVRLFLVDGTAGGLITAEIMNWTGHLIASPRSSLAELLKRAEVSRTGVYVLIGEDDAETMVQHAYIGEADDVGKRLQSHRQPEDKGGKDFWQRVVVITSKDTNLTKAHARFLESRLIAIARQAGRTILENATNPPEVALPEADVSDMEYFIDQVRVILPVLGLNMFRTRPASAGASGSPREQTEGVRLSPIFELRIPGGLGIATAQEIDGEFTVLQGSAAVSRWGRQEKGYRALRERLERERVLVPADNGRATFFARDFVFSSTSAAAAVALGRSARGPEAWRVQGTGQTYGDWQNRDLPPANDSA